MNREFDTIRREVEAGERWLSSLPTPGPSPEAMAGTKRALRQELASRADPARWSLPAWAGAVAAAAVIVFCVTVVRFSIDRPSALRPEVLVDGIGVPEALEEQIVVLVEMDQALTDLETWTEGLGTLDVGSLYEAFEDSLDDSSGRESTPTGTSRRIPSESERAKVTA